MIFKLTAVRNLEGKLMKRITRTKFSKLLIVIAIVAQCEATATPNIAGGGGAESGDYGEDASGLGPIAATTDVPRLLCTHVPPYVDFGRVQNNVTDEERELLIVEGRCYLTCTGLDAFDQNEVSNYRSPNLHCKA